MGQLLSVLLRRSDEGDYERILSDLDEQIHNAELRLSDIKLRERKTTVIFRVYSALAYCLYALAYFVYLRQPYDTPQAWLLKLVPLVGIPIIIYSLNTLVTLWYRRKRVNEAEYLENLKAKQKLKVEELKKKTAYYATRSLLERYDPSTRKPVDPRTPQGASFGPSRAMTTGRLQQQGGLRQRGAVQMQGQPGQPHSAAAGPTRDPVANPFLEGSKDEQQPDHSSAAALTNVPSRTPGITYAYSPAAPQPRTWMDRVVDAIVGEEGPTSKYALICQSCHVHNGLVLPEELDDIQYFCPKCNHFNASRRKLRGRATTLQHEVGRGAVLDTPSPKPYAQQLEVPEETGTNGTRAPRKQRPSLPDIRAPNSSMSDRAYHAGEDGTNDEFDSLSDARAHVERDAISEIGGDSEDERAHMMRAASATPPLLSADKLPASGRATPVSRAPSVEPLYETADGMAEEDEPATE